MAAKIPAALRTKLAKIKLFLCDVDGVLTDGSVWMGGGVETKRFNIRDGLGLKFLQRHGSKSAGSRAGLRAPPASAPRT